MEHPVAHSRMYIGVGTLISLTRPIDSVKLKESAPAERGPGGASSHPILGQDAERIVERIIRVKALHNLVFRPDDRRDSGRTRKVKLLSHRPNAIRGSQVS